MPSSLFCSSLMFLFLRMCVSRQWKSAETHSGGNDCTRDLFSVKIDPPSGNKGGGALQANLCCKKTARLYILAEHFISISYWCRHWHYKWSLFWTERLKYLVEYLLLLNRFRLHLQKGFIKVISVSSSTLISGLRLCCATIAFLALQVWFKLYSFCTDSQSAVESILLPFPPFLNQTSLPSVSALACERARESSSLILWHFMLRRNQTLICT